METSTQMIRRVDRELGWFGMLLFLWAAGFAVGKWFSIDALKADSTSTLLWFGFGGLAVLGLMVRDCANAVLAGIRESIKGDGNAAALENDPQSASEEDWAELWVSLPNWAKEELQQTVEDSQLRRHAQDLDMWPTLWAAAPEETKAKLRGRWKVQRVPSRKGSK